MSLFKKQRGASLVMVFIVLLILFASSLAIMQSSDSATMVASNLAFRYSATAAANVGVNNALTELINRSVANAEVNNITAGAAGQYYSTYPSSSYSDSNGLPTRVTWSNVPATSIGNNYQEQHVTERLCAVSGSPATQCITGISDGSTYYRVTVLITSTNSNNTSTSYVQAILKK